MHTTASPATGNPNPAAGIIVVQLQDNYYTYLSSYTRFAAPTSGISISTGLVVGNPYIITSLGASTAAQWQAAGVPSYITPAVNVAFIAAATSVAGGGQVQAPAGSGIDHIEGLGGPDLMVSNGALVLGAGTGQTFILACFSGGVITAPANGTVIELNMYFNDTAFGV